MSEGNEDKVAFFSGRREIATGIGGLHARMMGMAPYRWSWGLLERAGEGTDRRLLLTGQSLADELAAVEDLKQRIDALLQQHPALPGSESSE